MSDPEKIVLTSSLTVVVGVLVFVLGQLVLGFLVQPIQEQRKLIGEIADGLIFYGNIYGNPERGVSKRGEEAANRLRQLSTLLLSRTELIPLYGVFSVVRFVRPGEAIGKAARGLMGLSNNINLAPDADVHGAGVQNDRWRKDIVEALKLGNY